jgi:tetratricopeptide (TPR) repeat protein
VNEALAQGNALLAAGRPDLARDRFCEALRDDPDNGLIHALLAACLLSERDENAARKASDRAIQLSPDHPTVWRVHANVLNVSGAAEAGEDAATRAIELAPYTAKGFEIRGRSRLALRRPAEALEDIEQALALTPDDPDIHALRAVVLTRLGRGDAAEEAAADALSLDPESAAAHAALGWRHLHAGRVQPALEELQEALRIDPMDPLARRGLVESLKAQSPVYAVLLRLTLAAGRYRAASTWLGIGGLIAVRVLVLAAINAPATRPFAVGFVALWFACVGTLLGASPLFSFFASRTPQGRHVIDPVEARIGAGTLVAGAAAGLPMVAWAITGDGLWAVTALAAVFYAVLYAGVARPRTGWSRRIAVAALVCAPILQAAGITLALAGGDRRDGYLLILAPVALVIYHGLFIGFREARGRSKHRREPPARVAARHAVAFGVPWYIRWPVTVGGLFFGLAMIGGIQRTGEHNAAGMMLLCGSIYLALCGTAFAGRELHAILVDGRAGTLDRRLLIMPSILLFAAIAWVTALATNEAVVRGAFALACFVVCAIAPVLGRRSARPRVLAGSVLALAAITAAGAVYAIAAGDTKGPGNVIVGPGAGWAGFGLFMLCLLPIFRGLPGLWPARLRVRRAAA